MATCALRKLAAGQNALIVSVQASGELGRRIRDMGLVPGTAISVQGRAPLNDPVALKVGATVLTLRNNEADYITVNVL